MQDAVRGWRRAGLRVGLVPTMGALHEGHLRLVDKVRGSCDVVVMSIYVNPAQFGPGEDFSRYPRPFSKDRALAEERGVDALFHPRQLYEADDSTRVVESELSRDRCGADRPGHFEGVTTVVAKLFHIVSPDVAVFGQKDAQQCDVIERMVRDLQFPVKIVRAPIVRDGRGVALSSRNAYLSDDEYERAVEFAAVLREGAQRPLSVAAATTRRRLEGLAGVEVDYVTLAGRTLCAAVRIGRTRLIDNRKMVRRASR